MACRSGEGTREADVPTFLSGLGWRSRMGGCGQARASLVPLSVLQEHLGHAQQSWASSQAPSV